MRLGIPKVDGEMSQFLLGTCESMDTKKIDLKHVRAPSLLRDFLDSASSGGVILIIVTALALLVANSPIASSFQHAFDWEFAGLSIHRWINDALMAVFFLMVGLEIKREIVDGQLSTWSRRILPGSAALGGMIVPALIYLSFNLRGEGYPSGWAVPTATDIAFALGVLSLLGPRVPMSLRVFLTALAIIDDLGAVIVIALFYTNSINGSALVGAIVVVIALVILNRTKVTHLTPYLLLGGLLWFLVLNSSIHATISGVILALTVPLQRRPARPDDMQSPLHRLEHKIAPCVTYLILPLFAFANAGVSFAETPVASLIEPLSIGVMLGLFLGKQAGVFLASTFVIRAGWTDIPTHASWRQLYGVSILCGIGFTMSLFIGLLAFPDTPELQAQIKLGVLLGSVSSAIAGLLILRSAPAKC